MALAKAASSDVDAWLGAPAPAAPVVEFESGAAVSAPVSAVDGPVLPLAACTTGVALLVGALSETNSPRWLRFLARLLLGSDVLGELGVSGDEG